MSSDPVHPWPALGDLPPALPTAPTMGPELLPEGLGPWIADIARRMAYPLDSVGFLVMAAAAGMVGRSLALSNGPDGHRFWPVLWVGLVGGPGIMKSSTLRAAMRHLSAAESTERKEFEGGKIANETAIELLELELAQAKKGPRKKKGNDDDGEWKPDAGVINRIKGEIARLKAVRQVRYLVHDATPEALGELFKEFPVGLTMLRDELNPLLAHVEHPDSEMGRGIYNSAWDGALEYSNDRIQRGHVPIPIASLSLVGGIQPGPLAARFSKLRDDSNLQDGMLQRFVWLWPDSQSFPKITQAPGAPDAQAVDMADRIFRELQTMRLAYPVTRVLRFSSDAQAVWDPYSLNSMNAARHDPELLSRPHWAGFVSKLRSVVATLAMLFRTCRALMAGEGLDRVTVDLVDLEQAFRWTEIAQDHGRRVYAFETSRDVHLARRIADRIEAGDIADGITLRDLRYRWPSMGSVDAVKAALDVLERAGWVRVEQIQTGARPSERIWINPELRSE